MECNCPSVFEKKIYDDQEQDWQDKAFLATPLFLFYHIPLFYSQALKRLHEITKSRGLRVREGGLILQQDASWFGRILLEVAPVADQPLVRFESARIISAVWEGPWSQSGIAINNLRQKAKRRGDRVEKVFIWYASCPKCVERNGYRTVIFAELGPQVPVKISEPAIVYTSPVREGS